MGYGGVVVVNSMTEEQHNYSVTLNVVKAELDGKVATATRRELCVWRPAKDQSPTILNEVANATAL